MILKSWSMFPTDHGSSHSGCVQRSHHKLPTDTFQVSLCVQPSWLCPCDPRSASRSIDGHEGGWQGQAHSALDSWDLSSLLWQIDRWQRQVNIAFLNSCDSCSSRHTLKSCVYLIYYIHRAVIGGTGIVH